MKVLYVLDQQLESGLTAGIIYKIKDKVKSWNESGLEVEILSLYNFCLYSSQFEKIDRSKEFTINKHGRYYTLFRLILSTVLLLRFDLKSYDLVYMRQRLFIPLFNFTFKCVPLVIELNTNDVNEYRSMPRILQVYNSLTRDWFYKKSTAFLSVTYELAAFYNCFDKNNIVIANGIDVKSYSYKLEVKSEKAKVAFVGSPGFPWHGLDKIEVLASKLKDISFHIYGVEGSNTDNLEFHGYVGIETLKNELQSYDVAISTLSLHCKEMEEASPLKSRQYLAQALPIIYAYDDTDLSGTEDFALKLPNTENNINDNIELIEQFINKVKGNKEVRAKARKFAEEKLYTEVKEELRIDFIKKVLNEFQEKKLC